jgi:hypothetical protein
MNKVLFAFLCMLLTGYCAMGQLFDSKVYKVNPWIDGAVTLAAFGTNYYGMMLVDRKTPLDSTDIILLDANDINAFDRSATRQDASYIHQAWNISNVGMRGSFLLPALLMLDREIRQDSYCCFWSQRPLWEICIPGGQPSTSTEYGHWSIILMCPMRTRPLSETGILFTAGILLLLPQPVSLWQKYTVTTIPNWEIKNSFSTAWL